MAKRKTSPQRQFDETMTLPFPRLGAPSSVLLTTVTCALSCHCREFGMPRTCILVFICLLCRWPVLVQAQETADAAAVRALEMKWAESYKLRQLDVLSSLIDDDYVITFEDGSIHGKVGLLSHNAKPSEHVELSDF